MWIRNQVDPTHGMSGSIDAKMHQALGLRVPDAENPVTKSVKRPCYDKAISTLLLTATVFCLFFFFLPHQI